MEEKFNEKKKSNVLGFILMFILGAAVGAGCLFGYNKFLVKDANVADDSKNQSTEKSEESKEEDSTSKSSVFTNLKDDNYVYNPSFGNANAISVTLSGEDAKKCSVTFNKDYINNGAYGSWGGKINTTKWSVSANIIFDIPVKDVIIGGKGQAASENDSILFLMQDGTVRYINIVGALKSPEFTTNYDKLPEAKVIEGLNGIDRFYDTSVYSTDPTVVGGHGETIALKTDGTFINIIDYLK